ncbi:MAG: hypothetical protein IPP79_04855 [Chitinophagaceae bacterium]|nr:hypothetical protein [Chitinophagaceae bacterium]
MTRSILLVALLAGISGFKPIVDWFQYLSKDGNYTIKMPIEPQVQSQNINTAMGEITMFMAMVEADENDDNLLYMSAFSEYPVDKISSSLSKEGQDRFFKGAAEGAAKNMNGKVRTIKETSYKGFPARMIYADVSLGGQDFVAQQKLILVNNKFYMLQIFTKPQKEDNGNSKKFFDSFELPEFSSK